MNVPAFKLVIGKTDSFVKSPHPRSTLSQGERGKKAALGEQNKILLGLLLCSVAAVAHATEIHVGDEQRLWASDMALSPFAAFGKDHYLVVWQEGWPGANATADVLGMRLKAGTCEPLDAEPLKLCVAPEAQYGATAAFGRDAFLVVWHDFRNGQDHDIRGVFVDAATGTLKGGEIEIAVRPRNQLRPQVAWTGKHFIVVWQEATGRDVYSVRGARISSEGTVLDAEPFVVAERGAAPTVTASRDKLLYTWVAAGTAAALGDLETGKPGAVLGVKGAINPRCADGTAVAHDGQGNFMTVSARESFPNPWGWPGPGCVLFSRVLTDGSAPESKYDLGYRLNNACARTVPHVVDTATWGNAKTWNAGAPGGFKGTADGLWPNGHPGAAADGKGGWLFVWVKGAITPDRLNLSNFDIWLRGIDGEKLTVTVADQKIAADEDVHETRPRLTNGPAGEALLVYERSKANDKRTIAARKITIR